MRLWNVSFCGRQNGAIGIFYRLDPVTVDAPTIAAAIEAARKRLCQTHEHLQGPLVSGPLDSDD